VASELLSRGIAPRVLERAGQVCSSWRGHYESLHLNSPRALSSLPGRAMPRRYGQWVGRDDFIEYVESYSERLRPLIELGTAVQRVEPAGAGWRIETSHGTARAREVVVATGLNAVPQTPAWPGADGFEGEIVHAARFTSARPYRGRDVLVVGVGATGIDIAVELLRQGAGRVRVSVRTPPLLFRRHFSTAILSQAIKHARLPGALVDPVSLLVQRLVWGDLTEIGLGRPSEGLATALRRRGHGGAVDRGLVSALRNGHAEAVPAVERFEGREVVLADSRRLAPDVVIAATGQRTGLAPLVGHLGVLGADERPLVHGASTVAGAPGLHFLGFRLPAGQLPDMAPDARAIARSIARAR
jgi:putative flavoprotein involved in K+ transport